MSSEPARRRRARGSLSAEEILEATEQLIERDGLDGLSMPALARELGCGVTSIYWYFRSRDELLEAVVDRVTPRVLTTLPPVGDGPWDEELVIFYTAFRDLVRRRPLYLEVMAHSTRTTYGTSRMGRAVLRRIDEGLSLLTLAGFTPDDAARILVTVSNYAIGYVLWERGLAADGDRRAWVNAGIARVPAGEVPVLSQVHDYGAIDAVGDEQFRTGLRLLVQGIRRELEAPDITAVPDRGS